MSRRLSFFKSSKASSKLSIDTTSPPSSPITRECDSPVSYISIPGLSPTRRQTTFQSTSSQSSGSYYAEDMDDDNMAWGKPRKHSRRR
ncbi:hypothetical protein C2E23DRAFT_570153 [Lenzites betulinus]|nr:hypothetical protein C2E23DRAFT_570153 [Lenzites betulinus]